VRLDHLLSGKALDLQAFTLIGCETHNSGEWVSQACELEVSAREGPKGARQRIREASEGASARCRDGRRLRRMRRMRGSVAQSVRAPS
jgi:hypothetical protein